ncbi:MAG: alpha-1,2-fucosyltransferase [Bacteroidota bacterium]
MITYSKLGIKGNLGNQMFQIASTIGIAEKNEQGYFFPDWKYSKYFDYHLPISYKNENFKVIKEVKHNYHEWDLGNGDFDIEGWLQSEKYFNFDRTKEIFKLKNELFKEVYQKYDFLFSKKTILISVRRGDFVNNPNFFQLSFKYYLLALINNFPDWSSRNLIFTSDNINYCKYHFSFLKNAYFLKDLSPLEQLAIGVKCDDFVISNSTFSWWIAWLGEKNDSRIIHPIKSFRGLFGVHNDDSDFFPSRWISFNDDLFKLEKKYFILNIKGNIYSLSVNLTYEYLRWKKNSKNFVKKGLVLLKLRKKIL